MGHKMSLLDEVKLLVTSIGMDWAVGVDNSKAKDIEAEECVTISSPVGITVEIYRSTTPDVRGIRRDVYDASYGWDDEPLFLKPSKWSRRNTIFEAMTMILSGSFDRVTDSFVDSEG